MRVAAPLSRPMFVVAALLIAGSSTQALAETPKVDFSYAFAAPHRITIGRPSASDRTILDLQPGSLRMAWTYDNLAMKHFAPLSFRTPPTLWSVQVTPQLDGKPLAKSRWSRLDGVLPALENVYEAPAGSVRLEAIGGQTAALVRVVVANTDAKEHQFVVRCDSGSWGENAAWLDPKQHVGDNVQAGWNERADRVLVLGLGADGYSLAPDGKAPGPANMVLVWNLKPASGERAGSCGPTTVTPPICPRCANTIGRPKWPRRRTSGVICSPGRPRSMCPTSA